MAQNPRRCRVYRKDLELKDFEDGNCSQLSLTLSTALADRAMDNINRINHEIVLMTPGLLSAEVDIVRSRDYLESQGYRTTQVNSLEKAVKSDGQKRIFLRMMELSQPFLKDMTAEWLSLFQELLKRAGYIIWVTRGGGSQALPHFSIVDGVSGFLRNEYNQMRFFVVAFVFSGQFTQY
ncbi:hypothetical protein BOTNAR_0593g00030 [Botryotinia narcissicola]|uniref:HRPKS sdrA-like NAD(P)-binding domain-containing protein n=1 Tax=Botryotinia narcissicola TaxID=278944 RepID=A0A4Z1HBZ7_9HELO|nr:hypothetical protein BOTNAR_0593g00030 [Botryotinia narcissicola]